MMLKKQMILYFLFCFLLLSNTQKVWAQLAANFTSNTISGCAPLIVSFTDQSTGNPTQWKWSLGNGTTATQQNPTTTYFSPGSYTVKLVIQNAIGKDSIEKINYIFVSELPAVNFSASVTSGCYPLPVQFNDLTTNNSGNITEWTWDFGDGTTSSLQNPFHTYAAAGLYSVTLRVKNSFGCIKIINKTNYINVVTGPEANFFLGNTPSICDVPVNVNFINTSTGGGMLSYLWNFGDGSISNLNSPTHTYLNAGNYTVSLIVTNNFGCTDTLTQNGLISVNTHIVNFNAIGRCAGAPVNFSSNTTPTALSVTWNFGDGTASTIANPIKIYNNPGTYNVSLIANYGACNDTIIKPVIILPKPIAAFTQSNFTSCDVPLNVNFTNNSTGATSYQWSFGDGVTSTQQNVIHTYNQVGTYSVMLLAISDSGCVDSLKKIDLVKIIPPTIKNLIGVIPYLGCAPYTASYSALVETIYPITLYQWDFGDGSGIITGANPTHTYSNVGNYNITLIVSTASGCKDTLVVNNAVQLFSKPIANFSALPILSCASTTINYSDSTLGAVTSWFWQFGDGGSSNIQNPSHNYSDTGYFTITLIVSNNNCKDTLKIPKYLYILPPIARFIKTFSCDTPLQRRYINQSIGAQTYLWDFGDGTFSNLPNPVHIFPGVGNYLVKLTVTNDSCTNTMTELTQISTSNPNFSTNGSVFCRLSNVQFSTTGINNLTITNYTWNFGDANTQSGSNLATISHSYFNAGILNPTLIITDIYGCIDTISQVLPITIFGAKADFSNVAGTCLNKTMNFVDNSVNDGIHPINQWIWSYGDGKVDTLNSPPFSHQYNLTGFYDVKLQIKDSYGCVDSITKSSAVLITKPIADFISPDTLKCSSTNIQFNNLSQGLNLNYLWNFGDNTTDTSQNPLHVYLDSGYYTIKLKITDLFGCTDSIVKVKYIHVANSKSNFSFLVGDTSGKCYPYFIKVVNQSSYATNIYWDFGDGSFSTFDTVSHFYNYVGQFNLKLIAYGYGGCVDSVIKKITVKGPTGSFLYTPLSFCKNSSTLFKATSQNNGSFLWDFNDGNTTLTTDSIVTHQYSNPGFFIPKIILIDTFGCQVPIIGTDTIRVADVTSYIKNFPNQYCDSVRINFVDSSVINNDNVNTYVWNFGDNTTSNLQNPSHFYAQPGLYMVTLNVTTSLGCNDADTLRLPIKINQTPLIKITGDSVGCINAPLTYTAQIIKQDTLPIIWNWNFANGNTAAVQTPLQQYYSSPGTYIIYATSSNTVGCKDSVFKSIIIHPTPLTDAGVDTFVCNSKTISLLATGATSYVWNSHPSLSCTACPNPSATPNVLTMYKVIGSNSFGCKSADSVYVNVIQKMNVRVSATDTLCVGESAQLKASGVDIYNWSPAASLNNSTIPNPIANPITTTNYVVYGSDTKNCFVDTGYVTIKVYPIPMINIIDSFITANVGSNILLNSTSSSDITQWKWTPDKWLSCNNCPTPIALVNSSIKYTIEATNLGGCKTRDQVIIEALCDNSNIFIPNTFSPNGDGVNDRFYPRGKGLTSVKSMRIFNRWGQQIFSNTDFSPNNEMNGWDGTFKGAKLTTDVFVYVIEFMCANNQIRTMKGDVTLLR
jgi:gliding motility-associated-like protein